MHQNALNTNNFQFKQTGMHQYVLVCTGMPSNAKIFFLSDSEAIGINQYAPVCTSMHQNALKYKNFRFKLNVSKLVCTGMH